jgi:glutamine amidotransferase
MTRPAPEKPHVAILDYGMGNLRSVHRALLKVGADARLVSDPNEARDADALVFPGQGAIVDTMSLLEQRGWDEFLHEWIRRDRPFFGICLGLQALFDFSEEGETEGLGIFPGTVRRFRFSREAHLKVPHMGWNRVRFAAPSDELLEGIRPEGESFYFVHSYYVLPETAGLIWGTTGYGPDSFCSAIRRGNLVATQFHPEKSQALGLRLYANFINRIQCPA